MSPLPWLVDAIPSWLGSLFVRCPALLGVPLSVVILLNGHQAFADGQKEAAAGWWLWAKLILVGFAVSALVFRQWLSLALSAAGLLIEVELVRHWERGR